MHCSFISLTPINQGLPPNRPAYMASSVGATLRARCPDWNPDAGDDTLSIAPGNLWFFFNAMKQENLNVWEKNFNLPDRKLDRSKKLLYISYEESTLLRRKRSRCHNTVEIDVMEQCGIIGESGWQLKPRKRLTMENSSNLFNHLGPVTLEDPTNEDVEWCLPIMEKREILGDTRKEAGGPCPIASIAPSSKKEATDKEPVSWHGNSVAFWNEILHCYWAGSVTDLTPQNENLALAACMTKCKYVAICNSETHAIKMKERLQDRIFRLFRDPRCEQLYQPMAVADLSALDAKTDQGQVPEERKPPRDRKPRERKPPRDRNPPQNAGGDPAPVAQEALLDSLLSSLPS